MDIKSVDTLIFDLNGTLYEKGIPIPGAIETLNSFRKKNYNLNFVTNTDGRATGSVLSKIRNMGFDIRDGELLTPVTAAKRFIKRNSNKTFYLLVYDEVKEDLSQAIINDENPDYVIIGDFSDKMSYEELNKVFRFIDNGSRIVSLSNTTWYISEDGKNINTGAFVKMYESLCNTKALLLGKPSKDFLEFAINRTSSLAENTLIIGDDLKTDILGANSIGAFSMLVKTGVYNQVEVDESKIQPDFIIEKINDLKNILM